MAKTHPYFKFYCSEWNDGDITLESLQTQGVFINICSLYWSRECVLSLDKLKRRFPNNLKDIDILIEENLIQNLDDGQVNIRFLDSQWSEKDVRAAASRSNGKKGGRPAKPKKPSNNLDEPNIEKRIEENIREENIIEEEINSNDWNPPINPAETIKPEAGKRYEFHEIYTSIKPFNPQDAKFINSYFQAVSIADGEDVVNTAAKMYADYCRETKTPQKFRSSAVNWLDNQKFKTDWKQEMLDELYQMAEKGDKEAEAKFLDLNFRGRIKVIK